jgi:hypothetical protein
MDTPAIMNGTVASSDLGITHCLDIVGQSSSGWQVGIVGARFIGYFAFHAKDPGAK